MVESGRIKLLWLGEYAIIHVSHIHCPEYLNIRDRYKTLISYLIFVFLFIYLDYLTSTSQCAKIDALLPLSSNLICELWKLEQVDSVVKAMDLFLVLLHWFNLVNFQGLVFPISSISSLSSIK